MATITITLNGREVSGESGTPILELARESGIDIPTLCHDPHLAPIGACRVCLVEDERNGALLASCVTPIAPGMVINTASPRAVERRRAIIELLLASHPDSCLVCDKGNRCELRQIASDMGIGMVKLERIPQTATLQDVNPFIERDLSKCIMCAKCIRADHELVVEGAIDYFHRGFTSQPATLHNTSLEESDCTFCGTCVAICPTGALAEREKPYRGTTANGVSTICPYCGCGCSIRLEVKDNRIVRTRPEPSGGINRGALCARGSYGLDFVHSPERLTTPLARVNGSLKEVPWEHALDLVAARLKQVKEIHGADSLAVLGSSKCTNEENYLLQRFARTVLGTNHVDNGSRLCSSASLLGLGWTLGIPGTTNPLAILEQSQVILVIGANPAASAPVVGYAIKRAIRHKGARLLLVNPLPTRLSSFAHLWLRPRIGTDAALLNGLAKVIVDEGLLDEEFVARRTDNFEAWSKELSTYTLQQVERITGIPPEMVHAAARLFAEANHASIVYGNGITQHANGTDSVMALANLAMLTGNLGPGGGGVYALQRDCNGLGACDMGALPDLLPGYQSIEDEQVRKRFADAWGAPLPSHPGLTALEMVQGIGEGKIKGMYIVGENPAVSFPHLTFIREALASLDFLVVQDIFLTETAKLAQVVLPAASFAEKEGSFTNFEGRVQRLRKAITAPGLSLADWEIVLKLASRMDCPLPYSSVQEIMNEIEELVPFYQDIGYASPSPQSSRQAGPDASPLGTRRLYKGQFPKGFGRFSPVQYASSTVKPTDAYPFILFAGSILHHFASGSRSSRASRMRRFQPKAFVEISADDARRLGISSGDKVRIASTRGEVTTEARITDEVPQGLAFMPVSFPDSPSTVLFDIALDPRSKTPSLKACAVRLERNESHG